MLLGDVLGYTELLSPLLSLLMDEFTSLHCTLLTLLPPRSLLDFMSHRVLWTWLCLMPPGRWAGLLTSIASVPPWERDPPLLLSGRFLPFFSPERVYSILFLFFLIRCEVLGQR